MFLPARKILKVFFFGDSICFGQGVSPQHIWVCRIAAALEERFGDRIDLVVQNPSINGNTTRQAIERIAYDVQSHAPQIVLTQFGMNDCNGWETDKGHPRVSKSAFRANLSEIIDRCRVFGARSVLVGTNHPTTRTRLQLPGVDHTYDSANRAYTALIREVAAAKSAVLADAEKAFDQAIAAGEATYQDLVLEDELHLSKAGHDNYFRARLPLLIEQVERVAGQL
jgi:lysophospholipase L1-like esterase